MKINVSSAYANPNAVLIQKSQEIVQQIKENLPNKSTGNYLVIDRVDVKGEAECIIPTVDNKKVQLNYLHHQQAVSVKVIDDDGRSIELKQENIPLEIKNLKDPKAFNAFTKNVYAKVSMLSDGNYKVDINHRILGGMSEGGDAPTGSVGMEGGSSSSVKSTTSNQLISNNAEVPEGSMTPTTQGPKQYYPSLDSRMLEKELETLALDKVKILQDIKLLSSMQSNDKQLFLSKIEQAKKIIEHKENTFSQEIRKEVYNGLLKKVGDDNATIQKGIHTEVFKVELKAAQTQLEGWQRQENSVDLAASAPKIPIEKINEDIKVVESFTSSFKGIFLKRLTEAKAQLESQKKDQKSAVESVVEDTLVNINADIEVVKKDFKSSLKKAFQEKLKAAKTQFDTPKSSQGGDLLSKIEADIESIKKLNSSYASEFKSQLESERDRLKKLESPVDKQDTYISRDMKEIIFRQTYQQNIRTEQKIEADTPSVKRYGIDVSKFSLLIDTPLAENELHVIEKMVIQEAAKELFPADEKEKSSIKYPENVVLIDVFKRNTKENPSVIAEYKSSNIPETHTVVLWKPNQFTLYLIDPTNPTFTKGLQEPMKELINDLKSDKIIKVLGGLDGGVDIKLYEPDTKDKTKSEGIYSIPDKYIIGYSNLESEPLEDHKYRDCVDIAAKIGFELNELQLSLSYFKGEANFAEKILKAMFLQLSNKHEILKANTAAPVPAPFRALQSTDLATRRNARLALEMNIKKLSSAEIKADSNTSTASGNGDTFTGMTTLKTSEGEAAKQPKNKYKKSNSVV